MLYLYAITESTEPPEGPGLRGAPLRAIGDDGLFAIASEHDDLRIEAIEEDLWAHEGVVERLMDRAAVLPMRLGSTLPDEEAVLSTLRERRPEFTEALERVAGAVELGVRAFAETAPDTEPEAAAAASGAGERPGTAYMMARLESERHGADAAARIHEPLAALARASTRRPASRRPAVLNASYLVDRDRVDAFRARVEELEDGLDEATIVCTGPWPPYSFSAPKAAA